MDEFEALREQFDLPRLVRPVPPASFVEWQINQPKTPNTMFTFNDLAAQIARLTPEQRDMPAFWFGAEQGFIGSMLGIKILDQNTTTLYFMEQRTSPLTADLPVVQIVPPVSQAKPLAPSNN